MMTTAIMVAIVVVAGVIGERIWRYTLSRPLAEVESDHSGVLWVLLAVLVVAFAVAMLGIGGAQ